MKLKIVALLFVLLFLSSCTNTPQSGASSSGDTSMPANSAAADGPPVSQLEPASSPGSAAERQTTDILDIDLAPDRTKYGTHTNKPQNETHILFGLEHKGIYALDLQTEETRLLLPHYQIEWAFFAGDVAAGRFTHPCGDSVWGTLDLDGTFTEEKRNDILDVVLEGDWYLYDKYSAEYNEYTDAMHSEYWLVLENWTTGERTLDGGVGTHSPFETYYVIFEEAYDQYAVEFVDCNGVFHPYSGTSGSFPTAGHFGTWAHQAYTCVVEDEIELFVQGGNQLFRYVKDVEDVGSTYEAVLTCSAPPIDMVYANGQYYVLLDGSSTYSDIDFEGIVIPGKSRQVLLSAPTGVFVVDADGTVAGRYA